MKAELLARNISVNLKSPVESLEVISSLRRELSKEKKVRQTAELRIKRLEFRLEDAEKENASYRLQKSQTEGLLEQEIRTLKKEIRDLNLALDSANQQLAWFRKRYFGSQSEKTKPEKSIDSEVNNLDDSSAVEKKPETVSKKPRGQQAGKSGHGRSDRSTLPEKEVVLEIENCACPNCQMPYLALPATDDSRLAAINIQLFQWLYRRTRYVAQCSCNGRKLITAPAPVRLYPRVNIDISLWIHLLVVRFLNGEPTNRTLKDLSLRGLSLSAGTVTGGFEKINPLLTPLYEEIVKHCQGATRWHADETSHRVFEDNEGSREKKQWWDWVIASPEAVVYILDRSRSKAIPANFFAGSSGVLMSDRLGSYKNLHDAMKNAWCWVHQRRDFIKIHDGISSLKPWAKRWMLDITKIFLLNHERLKLWQNNITSGAQWEKVQKELEQHLKDMQTRCKSELKQPNLHKKQKGALNSLSRHWEGLTIFLADPRIPLDNNRAERLLRGLVVNRKNSYGSGKEWAGHMAAKVHTLFQTWLANDLNPHSLLTDYFQQCSQIPGQIPADITQFIPWTMTEERKQKFRLPKNYKKPG